jgi:hypothetical protein
MTDGIKRICNCCSKVFTLPAELLHKFNLLGFPVPVRCKACNDLKKTVKVYNCTSCKKSFELNGLEEAVMIRRFGVKYVPPEYCRSCRSSWKSKPNKNIKKKPTNRKGGS